MFLFLCVFSVVFSGFASIPDYTYLPTRNFQSSFPYITGDTVRAHTDHILDATASFNPNEVEKGDTVFVMINYLEHFFHVYHPRIKKPYVLVTAHFFDMSDDPVPGRFAPYLDDPKVLGWFSHNIDFLHPKMLHIPIGIGNACYAYGKKETFDECIGKFKNKLPRNKLLYMNFSLNTYPQERGLVCNLFKSKPFCTHAQNRSLRDYLIDVAQHKFTLSPRGNGLDCFRTWEAMLIGCIPIVRSSTLDPIFSDLPVLIVDNWNEVTEEFLNNKYEEMRHKVYNLEKLYMPYWIKKFKEFKK